MNEITESTAPDTPERRTWCYIHKPSVYEYAPCSCGNHDTEWSEFERHLWCSVCEKDFIPDHIGIFSGPIPVLALSMMGIKLDRIILATNEIEKFDVVRCDWYATN